MYKRQILSNWDPYGTASTSRISVAVASEDAGCEVLGLEVNIGALVLQGLESNDQMGWVLSLIHIYGLVDKEVE